MIRRIEDRGRLALDVGAVYPELNVIERLPAELSRLLIVSNSSVKSYGLQSELEGYEGIFESGGKREYKKYDSSSPHFKNEFSETRGGMIDIENAVAGVLKKDGRNPDELLIADQNSRIQEYKNIAKSVGIKGVKRQSDVYGLIELILRNLINKSVKS